MDTKHPLLDPNYSTSYNFYFTNEDSSELCRHLIRNKNSKDKASPLIFVFKSQLSYSVFLEIYFRYNYYCTLYALHTLSLYRKKLSFDAKALVYFLYLKHPYTHVSLRQQIGFDYAADALLKHQTEIMQTFSELEEKGVPLIDSKSMNKYATNQVRKEFSHFPNCELNFDFEVEWGLGNFYKKVGVIPANILGNNAVYDCFSPLLPQCPNVNMINSNTQKLDMLLDYIENHGSTNLILSLQKYIGEGKVNHPIRLVLSTKDYLAHVVFSKFFLFSSKRWLSNTNILSYPMTAKDLIRAEVLFVVKGIISKN